MHVGWAGLGWAGRILLCSVLRWLLLCGVLRWLPGCLAAWMPGIQVQASNRRKNQQTSSACPLPAPCLAVGFTYELCAGIIDKPGLDLQQITREEVGRLPLAVLCPCGRVPTLQQGSATRDAG